MIQARFQSRLREYYISIRGTNFYEKLFARHKYDKQVHNSELICIWYFRKTQ